MRHLSHIIMLGHFSFNYESIMNQIWHKLHKSIPGRSRKLPVNTDRYISLGRPGILQNAHKKGVGWLIVHRTISVSPRNMPYAGNESRKTAL